MSFDLDIRNYTITDIEKMFDLKPYVQYTASDIEFKEAVLRQQLLSSNYFDNLNKSNLIEFMETSKRLLIMDKCNNINTIPTTMSSNFKMDNNMNSGISRQSEIINKPETQYVNTFNDEFYAGSLNPINNRILSKCLSIDSKFRDNIHTTQSSDFIVQLPAKINKVVSMQISAIEFPMAFYGISANFGNNFLYIKASWASGTSTKIIVVPDGNYTPSDLMAVINNALCPKDTDETTPLNINSVFSYIEFVLDLTTSGSGTGKTIVQVSSSLSLFFNVSVLTIDLDFTRNINGNVDTLDVSSKLGWNLGFTKQHYTGHLIYKSESIVEIVRTRYIYLAIDDYNNNVNDHFINAFNKTTLNSNILARLSFRGENFFTLLSSDNLNMITEPRKYFGPVDIQKLHIRLYDEYGRVINMNNSDFSFCLNFKVIYDL